MYRVILENKYDYNYRSFAFCRSCYWTATIFTNIESYECPVCTNTESYECPVCRGEDVELMPLNLDEKYEYQLEPNKGLEIKFWTRL